MYQKKGAFLIMAENSGEETHPESPWEQRRKRLWQLAGEENPTEEELSEEYDLGMQQVEEALHPPDEGCLSKIKGLLPKLPW